MIDNPAKPIKISRKRKKAHSFFIQIFNNLFKKEFPFTFGFCFIILFHFFKFQMRRKWKSL